jgi:hypothetical protein
MKLNQTKKKNSEVNNKTIVSITGHGYNIAYSVKYLLNKALWNFFLECQYLFMIFDIYNLIEKSRKPFLTHVSFIKVMKSWKKNIVILSVEYFRRVQRRMLSVFFSCLMQQRRSARTISLLHALWLMETVHHTIYCQLFWQENWDIYL